MTIAAASPARSSSAPTRGRSGADGRRARASAGGVGRAGQAAGAQAAQARRLGRRGAGGAGDRCPRAAAALRRAGRADRSGRRDRDRGGCGRRRWRSPTGRGSSSSGASSARVAARDARGAQVVVERGHARFDVVHRARTRWRVAAGPFEIAVTGTSFDVDWPASSRHTLVVDLHAGSVIVRGGLAGDGLSLRAGQRLVADLDRGALSVDRAGDDAGCARAGARSGGGRSFARDLRSRVRVGGSRGWPASAARKRRA